MESRRTYSLSQISLALSFLIGGVLLGFWAGSLLQNCFFSCERKSSQLRSDIARTIRLKRLEAIENAKRMSKNTYQFFVEVPEKVPNEDSDSNKGGGKL
ncbi:MAG: hypothetical protein J7K17_05520 [Candidatus Omnitrophica bacterium]|nr:hypothetical protein [Candidatus Omnitrophota bacterium]